MRKLLVILAGVAVPVAALGFWYWKATAAPRNHFRTAVAERGTLVATIAATGTLQPEEVVDVGAQVAGRIEFLGPDLQAHQKVTNWGSEVDGPDHASFSRTTWLTADPFARPAI